MYAFHSGIEWDNQDCQSSIQDSECFQNDHHDEFSQHSDESDCEDEFSVPSLAAKNYASTIQRTGAI